MFTNKNNENNNNTDENIDVALYSHRNQQLPFVLDVCARETRRASSCKSASAENPEANMEK